MVIRWTDTFHATSDSRRFNVDIYPPIDKVFFFCVDSTSILRRKVAVRTWYIFQRRYFPPRGLSIHQHRIYVYASPSVFVDFSTLNMSGTLRSPMMSLLPSLTLYTSGANWNMMGNGSTRSTRFKNKSERKFTSNYPIVSWPGAPRRPGARWLLGIHTAAGHHPAVGSHQTMGSSS